MLKTSLNVEDFKNDDFVLIDAKEFIEQAEGVTAVGSMTQPSISQQIKSVSNLRLNPTQLNNLILSYITRFVVENNYHIEEGFVDTGSLGIRTYFKQLTKPQTLDFFVFQAACDLQQSNIKNNLGFINDIIIAFKEKFPELKAKLLIPLNQSRLDKRHSVLVEIDLLGEKIKINQHNSQAKWKNFNFVYPNCLNDLKYSFQIDRINLCYYQKQEDDISCGFFVYFYIKSILKNGNSSELKNIFVTLMTLVSNPTLLENTLNENFEKKYFHARRVTASGAALSWQETILKTELNKNKYQELIAINTDFPSDSEETNDRKMTYSR